jgi:hydroxylaminobenzene mutase
MSADETRRRLFRHGMFLLLLGLLTGLAEQRFTNARMGLAAHLEGLTNGILLMVLGIVWKDVSLPPGLGAAALRLGLYGTYANWLVTCLAAAFGTAALSPIAAAGYHGAAWQERLVTVGFITVGLSMLACSGLILWGLCRKPESG